MVIVINSFIGGFSMIGCFNCPIIGVWLQSTVLLHLAFTTLQKNMWRKSANAPIAFEEIVMVMIKSESMPNPSGQTASNIQIKLVR